MWEHRTEGGDNGWGEEKKFTEYRYIECHWLYIAKGEYDERPAYIAWYSDTGNLPILEIFKTKTCKDFVCDNEIHYYWTSNPTFEFNYYWTYSYDYYSRYDDVKNDLKPWNGKRYKAREAGHK